MTDSHTSPVTWIDPYVPENKTLAAIGELALRHSHLDHILRMTIKSLTGVTVDEALFENRKTKTWKLRHEIAEQAQVRLGEGEDFDRLINLLDRCRDLSDKRNSVIHDPWFVYLSEPHIGVKVTLNDELQYIDVPTYNEIQKLADTAQAIFHEINDARRNGWLAHAINRASLSDS